MIEHPCQHRTAPDAACRMMRPALSYASRGWLVFPCRPDKRPDTPHGFKNASIDRQTIVAWWTANPGALIGVPTGNANGFIVLDIDKDHERGIDGETAFQALLTREAAIIPATRMVRTPRGGRHIYFKNPSRPVRSSTSKIGPGLDIRSDGGYVIAPPSFNGNGQDYKIEVEGPIADLPAWLAKLIVEPARRPASAQAQRFDDTPDRAKVEDALHCVSADCPYATWIDVGMALHSWNPAGGRTLWDSWSRTAPGRYKEGMVDEKWKTFKPGAITIATLFKLATDAGWKPPRIRPDPPQGKPPAPSSNAAGILALNKAATLEEIGNALRESATAMKGLDKLSAALAREKCFRKLKELNVQTPAKLLAAAFDCDDASNNATAGGGQTITIEDPEPWPDPADGGELLQEIKDTIERYVVIPEQSAIAAALWVLHAHTQDTAFISPFLALLSPEKRCGKTTMLQVVGTLSPRRLFASNITPAALFRAVEKYCPTLMIDEADSFMGENEELRGILNSGHTKTTAFVVRTQGDDHDPAVFSTWCPKIIALIGKLRDTLEDRSIVISLRRKNPDEIVERLRTDRLKGLEPICRKAWRWGRDNLDALRNHEPEMPSELHDRASDNWRPLLAVAEIIGGKWPEHARHAALALSCRIPEESESIRELLLADIRTLFETRGTDCLFSENLTSVLDEMENRPWPEFSDGKPLTKTKLAKLLKPFGIASRTVRIGAETAKGYHLDDFQDAFSRYLPPENVTPSQPASLLSETDFSKRHTQEVCDGSESQETLANIDLLRCDGSEREVEEPPVAVEDSESSPIPFEEGEI